MKFFLIIFLLLPLLQAEPGVKTSTSFTQQIPQPVFNTPVQKLTTPPASNITTPPLDEKNISNDLTFSFDSSKSSQNSNTFQNWSASINYMLKLNEYLYAGLFNEYYYFKSSLGDFSSKDFSLGASFSLDMKSKNSSAYIPYLMFIIGLGKSYYSTENHYFRYLPKMELGFKFKIQQYSYIKLAFYYANKNYPAIKENKNTTGFCVGLGLLF